MSLMKFAGRRRKIGKSGQGLVEYSLSMALLVIVVIASLTALGTSLEDKFQYIDGVLGGSISPGCPSGGCGEGQGDDGDA